MAANNVVTLTFTSDGINGDMVRLGVARPDIGMSQLITFTYLNTVSDPFDEILIEPTSGTTGAVAAANYVDAFEANHNTNNDYFLERTDNVVVVTIVHAGWFFNLVINDLGTGLISTVPSTITIDEEILGQQAIEDCTYCYLYEPLRVTLIDSDVTSTRMFCDLQVIDTADNTNVIETLVKYGEFDLNTGLSITIDLMRMVQQHHDANIYNYSHIDEIVEDLTGWHSSVSKYKYKFIFYTDADASVPIDTTKLPIIGGRLYPDFVPAVDENNDTTEFDVQGVNLLNRWKNYPFITTVLADPNIQDSRPTIEKVSQAFEGEEPCGGYIIWKSRLGGWGAWGFDIRTESQNHKYTGNIEVGYFEGTKSVDGNPYIPVDYTGIETSYSLSLKSLSLTSDELRAVLGIKGATAVYYMKDSSGVLELMRLGSAGVPISNLANGGDFSVSLKSISRSSQNTR